MKINEINYTAGIRQLQISQEHLIANAKVIGDLDSYDVWLYDDGHFQAYFTCEDGSTVNGLIILNHNILHGIKNYTNIRGMITMLIGFVTHRLGMKIVIGKDEPLTQEGINWLCSLIKAHGNGLTITDQTGNLPNPDDIYNEWATAMKSDSHRGGPTEIFIEYRMKRRLPTKQDNFNEGRSLMPPVWFIGDQHWINICNSERGLC